MLLITREILEKAMMLKIQHGLSLDVAMREAYSDILGFGSTDSLTYDVLCELHVLELLTEHKIER